MNKSEAFFSRKTKLFAEIHAFCVPTEKKLCDIAVNIH